MSPSRDRGGPRRGYGAKRSLVNTIARERIQILLAHARTKTRAGELDLARRYVQLAKNISTRTKVRIPTGDKWFLCKNCLLPLIPGFNARVRLSPENSYVSITCLECHSIKRHPYSREKSRPKNGQPLYDSAARRQLFH